MARRAGRILGLALLVNLQGLSARSVRGSTRFLGSRGLEAAPAPATVLTAAECSEFSQAFLLNPQPSCDLLEYDTGGLASCTCKLPVPPQVRLADIGSSGHADSSEAVPTTLTCPFANCASTDGTSAEADSCISLKKFGFSEVRESSFSAEDTYRGTHTCSYIMEPGHTFAMPEEVQHYRYIVDSQNQAFGVACGGTDGLKKSTTMSDVCRRAIYRFKVSCDETWASMLPGGCENVPAPFGYTSESTVAELCALECMESGKFDVMAHSAKLKEKAAAKKQAEEKERQEAAERARLQAQEDARLKDEARMNANAASALGPLGAPALASTPGLAKAIADNPALALVLAQNPKLGQALAENQGIADAVANNPAFAQALVDHPGVVDAIIDVPGFAGALNAHPELCTAIASTPGFAEALASDSDLAKLIADDPAYAAALAAALAANPGKSFEEVLAMYPELNPAAIALAPAGAPAAHFVASPAFAAAVPDAVKAPAPAGAGAVPPGVPLPQEVVAPPPSAAEIPLVVAPAPAAVQAPAPAGAVAVKASLAPAPAAALAFSPGVAYAPGAALAASPFAFAGPLAPGGPEFQSAELDGGKVLPSVSAPAQAAQAPANPVAPASPVAVASQVAPAAAPVLVPPVAAAAPAAVAAAPPAVAAAPAPAVAASPV
mmetsp:Transcript_72555/g.128187  ORF Transcript_72555/g.128187 Transcript_72555/m.128187 type:complete len:665 (+) Transcript_72555:81-2075(+)